MRQTVESSTFTKIREKFGTFVAVARNCPYCERCACSGKTHMHACKPQSESDAATLLASGIAAGGYETHCKSYTTLRGERNWVAEAIEEPAGRQLKSRIAQISSCSEKKHIAERRGASAKGSVSEEVAQQRKVAHSSIHPSTQVSASFANAFSEVVCARALLNSSLQAKGPPVFDHTSSFLPFIFISLECISVPLCLYNMVAYVSLPGPSPMHADCVLPLCAWKYERDPPQPHLRLECADESILSAQMRFLTFHPSIKSFICSIVHSLIPSLTH